MQKIRLKLKKNLKKTFIISNLIEKNVLNKK